MVLIFRIFLRIYFTICFSLLCNSIALANGLDDGTVNISVTIDTIWVLLSSFLVFIMQAGFAMVEAGLIQAKNTANIAMKNLMDFAVGSVIFWLIGFGLMFGTDIMGLIGIPGFGGQGDFNHLGLSIPLAAFLLWQTVFCTTAATIVSGAMAGRIKFWSYIITSVFISAAIYPIVGHWIWGGGWLSNIGMIDFAGSTVVHSVGGWISLVGAYLIGPRIGKFNEDGTVNDIQGSNIVFVALGVFILWFGWFGFNCGSTLSGVDSRISNIAINTNLAAAMGAIMAMTTSRLLYGKVNVPATLNGALGGLVAITAGCADVDYTGALCIGIMAGILVVWAGKFIEYNLKIDDPVGAVSVHGICGAFGTVMVGLFATSGGLFYGGGAGLLFVQVTGVVAVFLWTIITGLIIFKAIELYPGLRVTKEQEEQGLDASEHSHGNLMARLKDISIRQQDLAIKLTQNASNLTSYSRTLLHSNEEVDAAIKEILSTTQQVASISESGERDAAQMVAMSGNVKSAASKGNTAVQHVKNRMNNINSTFNEMSLAINQLKEKSQRINDIIMLINEIADKTNLLALNASIECSRVGAEGRGFAVIAKEIRKLAENSAKAAGQITGIIDDMQTQTGEVVSKMKLSSEEIEGGAVAVQTTGKSLDNIIAEIERTSMAINQVARGATVTSEGSKILVNSTEQIAVTVKETSGASQRLADMAREIQNLIHEYKLTSGMENL